MPRALNKEEPVQQPHDQINRIKPRPYGAFVSISNPQPGQTVAGATVSTNGGASGTVTASLVNWDVKMVYHPTTLSQNQHFDWVAVFSNVQPGSCTLTVSLVTQGQGASAQVNFMVS